MEPSVAEMTYEHNGVPSASFDDHIRVHKDEHRDPASLPLTWRGLTRLHTISLRCPHVDINSHFVPLQQPNHTLSGNEMPMKNWNHQSNCLHSLPPKLLLRQKLRSEPPSHHQSEWVTCFEHLLKRKER